MEEERIEEIPCLEEFYAFVNGWFEIESPKGVLVGDAWFVLYPVVAVAVAAEAVVAVATAGTPADRKTKYFVKAERLAYLEMTAHGKLIELTCRWKEIWLGQRGGRISKIFLSPALAEGTHAVWFLLCVAFRARCVRSNELIGTGT